MDATTESTSVERELQIAASPETVWEFLVDPEKMTRWMGETAMLEPRPGGLYQVGVIPGHTARGEIVEFDPPRRLVFTWGWDSGSVVEPGSTTIEIELVPEGAGTLAQVRAPRAARRGVGAVARARVGPLPRAARQRRGRVESRPRPVARRRDDVGNTGAWHLGARHRPATRVGADGAPPTGSYGRPGQPAVPRHDDVRRLGQYRPRRVDPDHPPRARRRDQLRRHRRRLRPR